MTSDSAVATATGLSATGARSGLWFEAVDEEIEDAARPCVASGTGFDAPQGTSEEQHVVSLEAAPPS